MTVAWTVSLFEPSLARTSVMRLAKAPSYCAITNPTVNSFKRLLGLEEDKLFSQNKQEGPDRTGYIFESLRDEYHPHPENWIDRKSAGSWSHVEKLQGLEEKQGQSGTQKKGSVRGVF